MGQPHRGTELAEVADPEGLAGHPAKRRDQERHRRQECHRELGLADPRRGTEPEVVGERRERGLEGLQRGKMP